MVKVNVIGLDKVRQRFDNLPQELQAKVRGAMEDGAQVFVKNAKKDAPVNKQKNGGNLQLMISYFPVAPLTYEVVSQANYSAYIEWGTITKVSVPSELADYAIQFKGRGLRTTGGILPHPFFFKQMPIAKKQIEQDLAKIKL